jgi:hypothetical protein
VLILRLRMCDHTDVSQVKINDLQISDGNTRYTCKHCDEVIATDDVMFNREYRRYHRVCKHDTYIPTYLNENGIRCCNWCGVEI